MNGIKYDSKIIIRREDNKVIVLSVKDAYKMFKEKNVKSKSSGKNNK